MRQTRPLPEDANLFHTLGIWQDLADLASLLENNPQGVHVEEMPAQRPVVKVLLLIKEDAWEMLALDLAVQIGE